MGRLRRAFAAFVAANIVDWDPYELEIGSDDHCLDNGCGCDDCAELVAEIRARLIDEWRRQAVAIEDLREIRAIADVSGWTRCT